MNEHARMHNLTVRHTSSINYCCHRCNWLLHCVVGIFRIIRGPWRHYSSTAMTQW